MNTLIVYASKHGFTAGRAKVLAEKIDGEVDIQDLSSKQHFDLTAYDQVIVGGSIHMGKIRKTVPEFCTNHLDELLEKKVGLFICGMQKDEVETSMKMAYPKELLAHATATGYFGGEFVLSKLGFFEKFIVKKVAKVEEDVSKILEENLIRFVEDLNNV